MCLFFKKQKEKMKQLYIYLIIITLVSNAFAQKQTYIRGISNNQKVNNIGMLFFNQFVESEFNNNGFKEIYKKGKQFEVVLNVDTFKTAYITALNSRSQTIFITPGDSVFFVTDTIGGLNVLRFSGINSSHYNYEYMSYFQCGGYPFFKKGNDIMKYKDSITRVMEKKNEFLAKYIQENSVSEDFFNYAKADILNEYINCLYGHGCTTKFHN
jgi:hypothetical protein